jgi:hypothetical protein
VFGNSKVVGADNPDVAWSSVIIYVFSLFISPLGAIVN